MRPDSVADGAATLAALARKTPEKALRSLPPGELVRASGVGLTFIGDQGRAIRTLRDINLHVGEREIVGLVGPSGCGKTTLLRVVAGLLQPTEGSCDLDPALEAGRGMAMSMVFQRPTLLSWLSVEENVLLPYRLADIPIDDAVRERAERLFRMVHLEGFTTSRPQDLSGGMQMRAALVRAFLPKPRLIVMDEPLSALDEPTRLELSLEMLRLVAEAGASMLIVSHALQETVLVADRILQLSSRPGRIVAEISPQFSRPRDAALLDRPEFLAVCGELRRKSFHG